MASGSSSSKFSDVNSVMQTRQLLKKNNSVGEEIVIPSDPANQYQTTKNEMNLTVNFF